jgi:hypothetical protein
MNFSLVVDFLARIIFGSALFFGPYSFPAVFFFWPNQADSGQFCAGYGLRNKVTQREIPL